MIELYRDPPVFSVAPGARPRASHVARYLSQRAEFHRMLSSYYTARGWTDEGQVPSEKLDELGLTG